MAETEKGALVSGIAPDRVAALNWMISVAVAAIAGILIAPIVPLVPISYTLFIVPALAAAVLGRFQYVIPAVLGGLFIGMLQSEVTYFRSQHSWLPTSGLPELIPLVLILLVLVVRAKPLPSRGVILQRTLGRAPRPQRILGPTVLGAVAGALALIFLHNNWRAAMVTSFIFAIICLSLVVVTGYAGQVSLAQLTLAGVAGFLLATMTTEWSIPFPIAPILAALGATVVGVIVGLPAIRVRGLFVAVVTLAMAYAVQAVWFHNSDYVPAEGRDISGPKFFGLDLRSRVGTDVSAHRVLPRRARRARDRRGVRGVATTQPARLRHARRSRRTSGPPPVPASTSYAVKILAFAIAAFIAGLGGAMLGYKQGNLTFDPFDVLIGIGVFATAYLAGITSVSGGILGGMLAAGGIVYYATTQWLELGDWYATITGVGLVLTVVLNPEGIVGPFHVMLEKLRTRQGTTVVPVPIPVSVVEAASAAPADPSLLSLHDVRVSYGGVVAVDDVSFDVAEGSIVALDRSERRRKDHTPRRHQRLRDRLGIDPTRRARARSSGTAPADPGGARSYLPADRALRRHVGAREHRGRPRRRSVPEAGNESRPRARPAAARAERGCRTPCWRAVAGTTPACLDRSRAGGQSRVVLLDEPASGLDTAESQWLGERLRRIRDSGVTILMVDHDMHLVLNLCEQVHVLDFGQLIASGTPRS